MVLAAKEQQLSVGAPVATGLQFAEANRNGVPNFIDGSGFKRMTIFCDGRKMDKLINLVQAPVVISIVIVVVVFFRVLVLRAVDVTGMQVLDFNNVISGSECNCDSLSMKMLLSEIGTLQCYAIS